MVNAWWEENTACDCEMIQDTSIVVLIAGGTCMTAFLDEIRVNASNNIKRKSSKHFAISYQGEVFYFFFGFLRKR